MEKKLFKSVCNILSEISIDSISGPIRFRGRVPRAREAGSDDRFRIFKENFFSISKDSHFFWGSFVFIDMSLRR